MKQLNKAALSVSSLALALGLCLGAQATEWKGWNIHKAGYPNTVGMDKFAELVEQKSNGDFTIKMYHAGVLGNQPDAIEQVRIGGLEIGNFSLGPIGPIVKEANVLSLPFVFDDVAHMHTAMDGEVGDKINMAMEHKGLISLAWYDAGARSFYNSKKPITTPADLTGMKVRVMNNDLYSGMVSALGGNPSPIAYAEVYQSLKTGVVDGAENGWPEYESMGHFEVAGYYSLSQHLIIPQCLCVNAAAFRNLPEAQQQLLKEAAQESANVQRDLWAQREAFSRDKVVKAGVKLNEISEKQPFQLAMQPVYDKYLGENPELKPLVMLIKNTK
ncbi:MULTISPECIES: TRAP transporter substrate-binding protein [unclassified Agarivorans]|uniref:TRAP transporter substrate-binding protein n=1 Tax=unclassified Agarivorans TaxID=2636026 RepID=UPI0026E454C4|nr:MULTISPECIES: TRAP transporter substrate-binding protein [unclassified Agarivorans]MDO6686509.1 TRAP transporter substrate-binding protein [Agarivorans sp. 3_MG-2023]MDO6715327.1 TRAP transporter substrate-binding protein [Agarivorans sp. 2_MG-2023]